MKKEHLKEDSNGSSPEANIDSCPPSKTREQIEEECNELMRGFQRLGEIESKALMDWHYGLVPHKETSAFSECFRSGEHESQGQSRSGDISLTFYQIKKARWPFPSERIPWEVWTQ
jgi:hypothetical protein